MSALWRRISTDSHFIVMRSADKRLFLIGTQSEENINNLLEYIKNSTQYKGRYQCYNPNDIFIVLNTEPAFLSILNKHIFTDLRKT